MAKIIFLGTAGSLGVLTKFPRTSGGIILQIEDMQFHIDPGPGAMVKAKEYGINLHHTSAILVTHSHINHCNDLNAVIDAMTHSGLDKRGIVLASKSLLADDSLFLKHYREYVEKIIPLDKNHKVGIELVEINTLSAEHTDQTAVGFKFFCPKFTMSYTGDTKVTPQLLEELTGTDMLIMNVPYPGNKATGMNLDTDAAIKIVSHVRPKLAVMTHFGLEMLRIDPLNEAREVQRITGVQTVAARDGLVISPELHGQNWAPVKGF